MAATVQHVVVLREPGGTLTLDITFDSVTLLVSSVSVVNNLGHPYTFSITNALGVTTSRTLQVGTTSVDVSTLNWLINADASLVSGWSFNG